MKITRKELRQLIQEAMKVTPASSRAGVDSMMSVLDKERDEAYKAAGMSPEHYEKIAAGIAISDDGGPDPQFASLGDTLSGYEGALGQGSRHDYEHGQKLLRDSKSKEIILDILRDYARIYATKKPMKDMYGYSVPDYDAQWAVEYAGHIVSNTISDQPETFLSIEGIDKDKNGKPIPDPDGSKRIDALNHHVNEIINNTMQIGGKTYNKQVDSWNPKQKMHLKRYIQDVIDDINRSLENIDSKIERELETDSSIIHSM
jgi:hypothetical protein